MMSHLNQSEIDKLKDGIISAYAIPFIDDIEDYIWESIFCYVKNIPIVDPLMDTREKKLFDVVDRTTGTGWSAKALQTNVRPGGAFELVIQRADIFKKYEELGFSKLTLETDPDTLGAALMVHWNQKKIKEDMVLQNVSIAKVCILLKSNDRKRFTFIEEPLEVLHPNDMTWKWTSPAKSGLQGYHKGKLKYRWYHGQKQFFEVFEVPVNAPVIYINPTRLRLDNAIETILKKLNDV
jgi:hypothetical protein